MRRDPRVVGRWLFWLALLAITTGVLLWSRSEIDQSHAALTLLLVVLGGSAGGGRSLGFVLAIAGFIAIDYYFQPPFDLLSVDKPLDGVVLAAFLASAFVATELLTRARGEAKKAQERGDEIESLARIGSETLRYAEPEDALRAIAALVHERLRVYYTAIWTIDVGGALAIEPIAVAGDTGDTNQHAVLNLVAADPRTIDRRTAAASLADGSLLRGSTDALADNRDVLSLALPLVIESRRVGIMTVSSGKTPRRYSTAERRFLAALGYYAALGAERVRLAREAEHANALRLENKAKDEVLATVSHDLRTPLTSIKLLGQAVADRGDPNGLLIEEHVDRLANLVTNVLDLSRIRAGAIALDVALNTAEDLVGAAMARTSGIAQDRRIVPHIDWIEPALTGRFDFVQSLRILGNLLDNAIRYTPHGGVVDIHVSHVDRWIEIAVADSGPGVPAGEADRIFQPFYRAASDTPDVGHAGLGLSIARQLAELQGGTLTYAARDGGGSVFTMRLPRVEMLETVSIADD